MGLSGLAYRHYHPLAAPVQPVGLSDSNGQQGTLVSHGTTVDGRQQATYKMGDGSSTYYWQVTTGQEPNKTTSPTYQFTAPPADTTGSKQLAVTVTNGSDTEPLGTAFMPGPGMHSCKAASGATYVYPATTADVPAQCVGRNK